MQTDPTSVSDILDRIEALTKKRDKVPFCDMIEAMGHRSYGPLLIIAPLIDILPIGSIPGLPSVLALFLLLVAVQMLLGRKHLWLPAFLTRREFSAKLVARSIGRARPVGKRLDRWFHGRLRVMTTTPFVRSAAVIVMVLAFTVPFLEIIPLATTVPMLPIAGFGIALLFRDGLLMLIAIAIAIGAWSLGGFWLFDRL